MSKFAFSPGLPGFSTKGSNGTSGLQGIATYFSSFDGLVDIATITGRIANNQNLFGSATSIPGYPTRIYQTGDFFIDKNSKTFEIDLSLPNLFINVSGLNNLEYFVVNTTDDVGFERISNKYPSYILDNVYSLAVGDYTSSIYQPSNIYNIAALNFASIHYTDINPLNISAAASNYIPFMIFSSGPSYPGTADLDSFAIVKHKDQHLWRIGNVNGDPGTVRDVSLYLDFGEVNVNGKLSALNANIIGNLVANGSTYFYYPVYFANSNKIKALDSSLTFSGGRYYFDSSVSMLKSLNVGGTVNFNDTLVVSGRLTTTGDVRFMTLPSRTTETKIVYISNTGFLASQEENYKPNPFLEYFGGGIDGCIGISTSVSLTRDMYYGDVSIFGDGHLNPNGFKIFINGTLDLTKAPERAIYRDGSDGKPGVDGTGATGGTGGAGAAGLSAAVCGGSGAGGEGGKGADNGLDPSAGIGATTIPLNLANGGKGGIGGIGGGTGGAGGALGTIGYNRPYGRLDFLLKDVSGSILISGGNGGGGGGGGNDSSVAGGGGGGGGASGGGVLLLAASNIKVASTTPANCITVNGGNGGHGGYHDAGSAGGGGGGGAGGGGWIILIYQTATGTTSNAFISAAGGTGGTCGTGGTPSPTNGIDGSAGTIHMFNISNSSLTVNTSGSVTTLP